VVDAKRGKAFSKVIKEITVAAKNGGGDPDKNPKLRMLIIKAKEVNMPQDNIVRAIKKGTGELPGVTYEEQTYEGFGPGGVAILVDVLTDNKNRSASELRMLFSKKNGNMAGAGSVNWMFNRKGYVEVSKSSVDEDKLFTVVTEAGAEDFVAEDENYEITVPVDNLEDVKKAITDADIAIEVAEVTQIPQNLVKISGKEAKQALALVEELEDHEDVQDVYANFDIAEEDMPEDSI